jgi:hypothetical protein
MSAEEEKATNGRETAEGYGRNMSLSKLLVMHKISNGLKEEARDAI